MGIGMSIRDLFKNKWVKRGGLAAIVVIAIDLTIAIGILAFAYFGYWK
jgi:hypothetical protein